MSAPATSPKARALELLQQRPGMTVADLVTLMGLSRRAIARWLAELRREGLVRAAEVSRMTRTSGRQKRVEWSAVEARQLGLFGSGR